MFVIAVQYYTYVGPMPSCMSVRQTGCLSCLYIPSKRVNISSEFFHHWVATLF